MFELSSGNVLKIDLTSDPRLKMKVVALISGGKDSCYNMLQCVMAGHEIVALANLKPDNQGTSSMSRSLLKG